MRSSDPQGRAAEDAVDVMGRRIAQLEAGLAERTAQYEYSAGVLAAANARLLYPEAEVLAPYLEHPLVEDATAAALRLAARDAALAAAHEALRVIREEAGTHTVMKLNRPYRGGEGMGYVRQVADRALSAPALTRAAEELRLLRELEAEQSYKATAHDPDCQGCRDGVPVVIYGTTRSHVFGEWDMRPCPISPALANLRRFREQQAPEEPRG